MVDVSTIKNEKRKNRAFEKLLWRWLLPSNIHIIILQLDNTNFTLQNFLWIVQKWIAGIAENNDASQEWTMNMSEYKSSVWKPSKIVRWKTIFFKYIMRSLILLSIIYLHNLPHHLFIKRAQLNTFAEIKVLVRVEG